MKEKRVLSNQAQVAGLCRKHIKALGLKCKVTSKGFSMGDSVNIKVYDIDPDTFKAIKLDLSIYQQGHFDGITDMYEYSNYNKDIPQTKYLSLENCFNDTLKNDAWDFLCAHFVNDDNGDLLPATYNEGAHIQLYGRWATDTHWQLLSGALEVESAKFWAERG